MGQAPTNLLGALALASGAAALGGCMSAQAGSSPDRVERDVYVKALDLSEQVGVVGKQFRSEISFRDNYIEQPQYSVSGLPPGLAFDEDGRRIEGVPERPGFYTVNVAVRQRPKDRLLSTSDSNHRWWPRDFEVAIYQPVTD